MLDTMYKISRNRANKRALKERKRSIKLAKREFVYSVATGRRKFQISIFTSLEDEFEKWLELKKNKLNFHYSRSQSIYSHEKCEYYFEITEEENSKIKKELENFTDKEDRIYKEHRENDELEID